MEEKDPDIKRMQGLVDATFAVAMTILILEIKTPHGLGHSDLIKVIIQEIIPSLFIYVMSFIVLAAFWIDSRYHHYLLNWTDRVIMWLIILFLMFICIIPFSSSFLINYRHDPVSIIFYCANLLCASLCHYFMVIYTWKKGYMKPHITKTLYRNLQIRILIPTIGYCILIPLAFVVSGSIRLVFLAPLLFHIFFGRSRKEIKRAKDSYLGRK